MLKVDMDAVFPLAEKLVGAPILSIELIRKGGNNRLYRVETPQGKRFVLKNYLQQPGDPRDRLTTECQALAFLNSHEISQVPRLIAVDPSHGCALLEWIEGSVVTHPTQADIMAILHLVNRLQSLSCDVKAKELPLASAACLSGADLEQQVRNRLARLQKAAANYPALAIFISDGLIPQLEKTRVRIDLAYQQANLNFQMPLPQEYRLLSPSDFGFHNCLRRADGSLIFFDFEYFGWDDPVKMAADFVLHPGMNLADDLRSLFIREVTDRFQADDGFPFRLKCLLPLFGLCWCMIMLNEFLPEGWQQRAFSAGHSDPLAAQARQLAKAKRLLAHLEASTKAWLP